MPRVAAKDRDAFVEERRDAILEAALKVFAERGFDATPLEAVAREVGLTKGTLYLYFESKDALLDALVRRYSLRPLVEDLSERLVERPLEEVVRLLVETAWQRLHDLSEPVRMLMRELPRNDAHTRHFLEEVLVPTNQSLARYLDGALSPERAGRLNSIVAARSLIGMVLVFFVSQKLLGADRSLPVPEHEVTDTIVELFLHGAAD